MFFERAHQVPLRSAALFTGDIVGLVLSLSLAAWLRLGHEMGLLYMQTNRGPLLISLGAFLLVYYISGMYERQLLSRPEGMAFPTAITVGSATLIIVVLFYAKFDLFIGRGVLFLAALFAFCSALGLRHLYRAVAGYGVFSKNALIVGEGKDAERIVQLINSTEDAGCRIYGVVTHTKKVSEELLEGVPVLGTIAKLREFVAHYRIETLIVATSMSKEHTLLKVLRPLRYSGVEVLDYASFYEQIAQEIPLDHIDDEWLMHAAMNNSRIHIRKVKRIMDVVTAVLGLLLSAPISAVAAICIRMDSPGPVLFRQTRAGLDGKLYTLYKFRTMQLDAEVNGAVWAGRRDPRITRVGHYLRLSRIDEIPQLINVLRGEMSLVGPRPERPEFVEELAASIPFYRERLMVHPGITGWAQVKFPYAASIKASRRKLQYDLYYIKHMSFVLDVVILLRTFKIILVGLRHSEEDPELFPSASQHSLTLLEKKNAVDAHQSRTA